jgi:hypothetical protein
MPPNREETNMTDDASLPAPAAPDPDFVVRIEWPDEHAYGGYEPVAKGELSDRLKEQSEKAPNVAMGTLRAMAYRVSRTMREMDDQMRPQEAEVEFGVNLDAEAGAWLARTSAGAQLTVKLKWVVEKPERVEILTG